jgi:hypothetical protein
VIDHAAKITAIIHPPHFALEETFGFRGGSILGQRICRAESSSSLFSLRRPQCLCAMN